MAKIKAVLLKPLDGDEIGSEREFDKADFDRLKARGAVEAVEKPKGKAAEKPKNKAAPKPKNKSA